MSSGTDIAVVVVDVASFSALDVAEKKDISIVVSSGTDSGDDVVNVTSFSALDEVEIKDIAVVVGVV